VEVRRLGGALLAALGVAVILLGLLFLVGSAGRGSRLATAAVAFLLGAVVCGLGVRLVRRAATLDPARLEAELLALGRQHNGEVAETEVAAALGDRLAAARPVLDRLLASGTAQRHVSDGAGYLVFPALQPRLQARHCEYCGAELPVSDDVASCPQCGGKVATRVVRRSLAAGEVFAMDEEESPPGR
jgi:hypothetical protein